MRSLFRRLFLGLICSLLIASSDVAVNAYGRSGPPPATAQSSGVVTVYPTSYQTPFYSGDLSVSSPSNTGHGTTNAWADSYVGWGENKSCKWFAFQPVSGQTTRITLKFDWSVNGAVRAAVAESWEDSAFALAQFFVLYSTNNGSNVTYAIQRGESASAFGPSGYEDKPFSDSGSFSVDLPANTPINQIIVQDRLYADASGSGLGVGTATVNATISNVRLEVEWVCFANITPGTGLGPGQSLLPGQSLHSPDGQFLLAHQTNGNVALYYAGYVHWATNTGGQATTALIMQYDGNLVLYNGATPLWASNTDGQGCSYLVVQNDGNVVVYKTSNGAPTWATNTTWVRECFANVSADRWKGEYFNNTNLSGSPAMVRDDGGGFFNRNFGDGGPGGNCGLGANNFSARWTQTVNFAAGTYRFTATVDNGFRLYVDGQLKIDQWADLPPNTYTANVALSSGPHVIRLEFVEYSGAASASLSWVDVTNCIANVPSNRWSGEYYNNTSLAGAPWMARDDGASFLNFNFGNGGPGGNCSLGVDNFSARWTRMVYFEAGTYRFSVTGDDGVKLYVGGQPVIDKWFSQGATTYTENVTFNNSGPREVKLEYFESGGPGVAILTWVDLTGVNCLPDAPLPLISTVPQTSGKENIASTAPSQTPKRCDPKIVTAPRAPGSE